MFTCITIDDLPLQRAYRWEVERADSIVFTQPLGNGVVRDWTWAQAMNETRRVAAWLRARQMPAGSRIAILSRNTAWWIMADLAIWMAGHVSVPIYPNLTADSVRQILVHAGCALAFVGELDDAVTAAGIPEAMPTVGMPLGDAPSLVRWDDLVYCVRPLPGRPAPSADTLATLIYTSGTTGTPKGVMHDFAAFAHTAKALQGVIGAGRDHRTLSHLPLAHVAERCLIEGHGLYMGTRIFFAESLDTLVTDLQHARPTFFFSVPRLWAGFQQRVARQLPPSKLQVLLRIPVVREFVRRKVLAGLGLDSVRFAGVCAAPLPPEVLTWYRSLGLDLLEGYGMTEQFALATTNLPGRSAVGSVGEPTPCCEVRLSPEGEVLTRGPAHMRGYYADADLTAEVFTENSWLHTGDLGRIDATGRLSIVGRLEEQFRTSVGHCVSPAPIEGRLVAFKRIEACMVVGAGHAQPFAMAVLPADAWRELGDASAREAFERELAAHLVGVNAQLDPHERLDFVAVVPDQWTVPAGFVTPMLTLVRSAIERHYAPHFVTWAQQRRPVVWHQLVESSS